MSCSSLRPCDWKKIGNTPKRAVPSEAGLGERRERIDHVVVLGERHLRHVLLPYQNGYNDARTYLSRCGYEQVVGRRDCVKTYSPLNKRSPDALWLRVRRRTT